MLQILPNPTATELTFRLVNLSNHIVFSVFFRPGDFHLGNDILSIITAWQLCLPRSLSPSRTTVAVRNSGLGRLGLGRADGGLTEDTDLAFKAQAAVVVRFTGLVQRSAGALFFDRQA